MAEPHREEALERLDALVGEWTMQATPPGGPPWPGEARVAFEWLEGRGFLIQRWTVDAPGAPSGIAVIGPDESGEAYAQHYFDSRGVHRVYRMSLGGGEWRLWREGPPFAQRFAGRFDRDGDVIAGRWEIREEGADWRTDFDLTYTRVR